MARPDSHSLSYDDSPGRPTRGPSRVLLALALGALTFATPGCRHGAARPASSEPGARAGKAPVSEWQAWQAKRRESVAGTNGWATLVGLHWLEEGPNSAGSAPTNQAVLPAGRAAAWIGTFVRSGREVRFEAAPGMEARVDGLPVASVALVSDANGAPTRLVVGELTILVLERGSRMALRVRDPQAPTRVHFRGLEYFRYDPAWRITGRFEPATERRRVQVPDVTGGVQSFENPGALVFEVAGLEHRLQAVLEPDETRFFVIFRDQTAGKSTYPAGRFLYVDPPDAQGRVILDFNRAYNPPCAFTPFATCPLPPASNRLPFAIRAGERKPAGH